MLFALIFIFGCGTRVNRESHTYGHGETSGALVNTPLASPTETTALSTKSSPKNTDPLLQKGRKRVPSSLFVPYSNNHKAESEAERALIEGDQFYKVGDFNRASELYHKALSLNSALDEAHIRLGDIYIRKGEFAKAEIEFKSALKINPNNKFARLGYADILMENDEPEKAKKELETILLKNPDFAPAITTLGDVYVDLKEYKKAEEMFLKSLKVDPLQAYPDTYIGLGELYLKTKKYLKALDAFRKAQKKDPYDIDGFIGAARALTRMEKFKEAEQEYLRALEINPTHEETQIYLAQFYIGLNKLDKAERVIQRLIKQHGEDDDIRMVKRKLEQLRNKNKK